MRCTRLANGKVCHLCSRAQAIMLASPPLLLTLLLTQKRRTEIPVEMRVDPEAFPSFLSTSVQDSLVYPLPALSRTALHSPPAPPSLSRLTHSHLPFPGSRQYHAYLGTRQILHQRYLRHPLLNSM